jgi:peptide/nickel transport system substrate-binding protein
VIHRECFHSGGAFRVGPVLPEFEDLMGRSVVETGPTKLGDLGEELDKPVYDEAPNVFQCRPQALVAVNKHVDFTGRAATLELAETEVGGGHWSRRNGG